MALSVEQALKGDVMLLLRVFASGNSKISNPLWLLNSSPNHTPWREREYLTINIDDPVLCNSPLREELEFSKTWVSKSYIKTQAFIFA